MTQHDVGFNVGSYQLSCLASYINVFTTTNLLTYSSSLKVEQRAKTTLFQRTLLFVAFFISFQVVPCFFTSSSIDLLQIVLVLPVFLFPCGFQSKACLVTLLFVFGGCVLSMSIFFLQSLSRCCVGLSSSIFLCLWFYLVIYISDIC